MLYFQQIVEAPVKKKASDNTTHEKIKAIRRVREISHEISIIEEAEISNRLNKLQKAIKFNNKLITVSSITCVLDFILCYIFVLITGQINYCVLPFFAVFLLSISLIITAAYSNSKLKEHKS